MPCNACTLATAQKPNGRVCACPAQYRAAIRRVPSLPAAACLVSAGLTPPAANPTAGQSDLKLHQNLSVMA